MRISSAKKPLNRTTARNSFLINQLATPGLGSLMAGRFVAGIGQLFLALIGAVLIIVWFVKLMAQVFEQLNHETTPEPVGWLLQAGALLFAVAWVWSLVTSLSLMREAKANETESKQT